jgi:hypothetical protein
VLSLLYAIKNLQSSTPFGVKLFLIKHQYFHYMLSNVKEDERAQSSEKGIQFFSNELDLAMS